MEFEPEGICVFKLSSPGILKDWQGIKMLLVAC